jgi:hypothetical protein
LSHLFGKFWRRNVGRNSRSKSWRQYQHFVTKRY